MRLALDTTYSLGRNLSGVGNYSRELLWALARTHPDDRLLCYYRPHRFLKSFQQRLPANAQRRLLLGAPGGDIFHALNQRVDRPGKRTLATFHDLFVMTSEYSTPEFRERFTRQAREAAERSDLILAVSEFTAQQVEHLLRVERSRIRVVPHGVRLPERLPDGISREPMILFVGAIQRRKNVARLVGAFELAQSTLGSAWRLVLAGAADGFGATDELAAVERSPSRAQIDVKGYVSAEELEQLWARASVFAFPSLDEGFGMPVLEAMARGVPVVTSSKSALPEVASDAALLVDPEDVEQLAAAMVRAATDAELRTRLSAMGLERATAFSWAHTASLTWDAYQELL